MTIASAPKRFLLLLVCLAVGPALFPGRAHGLGRRHLSHCFFTEPTGLREVRVLSESLLIDLRPMSDRSHVAVEAVYHLENPGKARKLTLTFLARGNLDRFEALLNETELVSEEIKEEAALADWTRAEVRPGRHGYVGLPEVDIAFMIGRRVQFTLPEGRHTLAVQYQVPPSDRASDPTILWTLKYVPAPAREWEGFGGLELTIHAPDGWKFQSVPDEMPQEGDTRKATFRAAPAQDLTFQFQAAAGPAYYRLLYIAWVVTLLLVVGGLGGSWWFGRVWGRQRTVAWPAAVGLAVLWTSLLLVASFTLGSLPETALPKGQAPFLAGMLRVLLLGLFGMLALPVGYFVVLVTAVRVRRQAMPNEDSRADRNALVAGMVLVGLGILITVANMLGTS
jgi:hypothetical protein